MGLHFASWQLSTIAVPNAISFYCKMFFQFDTDKLNGLTLVWLLAHSFDQLSMMMLMLKSILSSWISHSHSHSRFGKCMEDKIAPTIFTQEFQANECFHLNFSHLFCCCCCCCSVCLILYIPWTCLWCMQ